MRVFNGFDVLDGSIFGVAGDVTGSHAPAEDDVPEQIEHGLVVHHFARGDQHRQDDAAFASIGDIVGLVAQVHTSAFEAHQCGIWIGGTDSKIRCPLIEAMDFPLLPPLFRNPVMACRIVDGKFFSLYLRENHRQRRWGLREGALRQRFRTRCLRARCLGAFRLGSFLSRKAPKCCWMASRASTAKRGVRESRSAFALTCVESM